MRRLNPFSQSGVSMIETVIIFPIVLMIGLWIIHIGLVYQARANLEYAALMGARVGAVTNINIGLMQAEIANRLTASQMGNNEVSPADVSIEVLNPTPTMFMVCGVTVADPTVRCSSDAAAACEIPNFGLQFRSDDDDCDGVSIQDANILRIRVSFNFESNIPFMNVRVFRSENLASTGTTVIAVATVRMQSPARISSVNSLVFP